MSNDKDNKTYRERADEDLRKRLCDLGDFLGVDIENAESNPPADTETAATHDSAVKSTFDPDIHHHVVPNTAPAAERPRNKFTVTPASEKPNKSAPDKKRNVHEGHRARLRESIKNDSELNGFSDVELIETLLSFVIPRRDTNVMAHDLLDKFGSVLSVMQTPPEELVKIKGMTEGAAVTVSILASLCMWNDRSDIKILNHSDASNLFASIFVGSNNPTSTHVAYLNEDFTLVAIEKLGGAPMTQIRAIVGSTVKHNAQYVIVARHATDLPDDFDALQFSSQLVTALGSVETKLLDFMMFGNFGYYSLGVSALRGSQLEFVFIPLETFSDSPELINRLRSTKPTALDWGLTRKKAPEDKPDKNNLK